MGVLEHVMDPGASLDELRRVLVPGGLVYCYKLPNRFSYLEFVARHTGRYFHGEAEFDRLYDLAAYAGSRAVNARIESSRTGDRSAEGPPASNWKVWPGCLQPDVRIAGDHQVRLSATAALARLRFWFPGQCELYLQQGGGICKSDGHQRRGRHSPGFDSGVLQNYGPMQTNIPQNFQVTSIYELPWGKGRPWLSSGLASKVLGGWQLSGLFSAYSGLPFTVAASATSLNAPFSAQFGDCL